MSAAILQPQISVDKRFVTEVQANKYWEPKRGTGWSIRITQETVFNLPKFAKQPLPRLVAFYLVEYGSDKLLLSDEFGEVLFTMPIDDFLYEYKPLIRPAVTEGTSA